VGRPGKYKHIQIVDPAVLKVKTLPSFLPCHQNERQPCPPCPMLHASFASISVSPLSLHELEIRVSAVT
jgi:hypothetical protein